MAVIHGKFLFSDEHFPLARCYEPPLHSLLDGNFLIGGLGSRSQFSGCLDAQGFQFICEGWHGWNCNIFK